MSSRSKDVAANFFFLNNLTCLVFEKVFVIVYNFYLSSQLLKLIKTLLKLIKNIFKAISILILANKNVTSEKQDIQFLLSTEKKANIILNVYSLLLAIF